MKEMSLKEIQDESFKVLLKIKEIFDKNNWKYFLTYGTLIGAVRHHGFIPWDDDIDIWVPRDDYEKFIDYCIRNKEELKPFELIHYTTNKNYIYPIARFSDSRYEIKYNIAKDYGLGLFVDIYPLDGYRNDRKQKKKIAKYRRCVGICGLKEYVKSNNFFKNIIKYPYCKYVLKKYKMSDLLFKMDKIAQKYDYKKEEEVQCVEWNDNKTVFKKEWIMNQEDSFLDFNGIMFRVPYDYHEVLKAEYGNYMELPPKEQQVGHHYYSAYKK